MCSGSRHVICGISGPTRGTLGCRRGRMCGQSRRTGTHRSRRGTRKRRACSLGVGPQTGSSPDTTRWIRSHSPRRFNAVRGHYTTFYLARMPDSNRSVWAAHEPLAILFAEVSAHVGECGGNVFGLERMRLLWHNPAVVVATSAHGTDARLCLGQQHRLLIIAELLLWGSSRLQNKGKQEGFTDLRI